MRDGFKIIDADRHVLEPSDLFDRYLPQRFRGRVKVEGPNQTSRFVDGEPVSDSHRRPNRPTEDFGYIFAGSKRWRETFADALAAGFDPASNLARGNVLVLHERSIQTQHWASHRNL